MDEPLNDEADELAEVLTFAATPSRRSRSSKARKVTS
jgi:hypothetical protein